VNVTYACAASWLPTYKVGLMQLTGDDPLDPDAWLAHEQPAFESSTSTYGVGHGSFVSDADDRWWHVYHSKIYPVDGWQRTLHLQPITTSASGTPLFGTAVPRGEVLPVPAGTPWRPRSDVASWTFGVDGVADFDYYGHHQFFAVSERGLDLGCVPEAPVNDFRSAEKFVLRDGDYSDLALDVTFDPLQADRSVGLLFRTTGPSIGVNTQRGYYAGVSIRTHQLLLGRFDGDSWTLVGTAKLQLRRDRPHTLSVMADGDHLQVTCSGAALDVHDDHYTRGSVGVRVVDCHARFLTLSVAPR
jgi:hypothetical protein